MHVHSTSTATVEAMVHRYHKYCFVGEADIREELPCKQRKQLLRPVCCCCQMRMTALLAVYHVLVRFPLFDPMLRFSAKVEKYGLVRIGITEVESTHLKY